MVLSTLLLLFQAAAPAATGQLYLGRADVAPGTAIPALLVISAPDTVAALAVDATVTGLPGAQLWPRAAGEECGAPPPGAHRALTWRGTVRGDEQVAFCAAPRAEGPLRLAATLRTGAGAGARTRAVVSDAAARSGSFFTSTLLPTFIPAVIGFGFGLLATLFQQREERKKRKLELEEDRRAKEDERIAAERASRIELQRKVFESVSAEVQRNVDALRRYADSPPVNGEREMILSLAGMGVVLGDPRTAAYLRDGGGEDVRARMERIYRAFNDYNHAVRAEPDLARRRDLARATRDAVDPVFHP